MVKKKKNSDKELGLGVETPENMDSVSHRYIYYTRRRHKECIQEIENVHSHLVIAHDGTSCLESEKCETDICEEVKTAASALTGRWMAKKRRSVVRKRSNVSLKVRRRNFKYIPKVVIDVKPREVPVKLGKRKKTEKDSVVDSKKIDQKSASKSNENLIVYHRRKHAEKILSWIDLLTQGPKKRVTKKKAKSALVVSKHTKRRKENLDIVPYKETTSDSKQMVLLNLTPKTQLTPKVALDDMTVKEWEMLMAKPDSESNAGEADEGETEWWKKERDLLDERVASFISNMNLIQGERKFSKWKGSVMDSIGGAYLTQNVNDTLSSSAFISLAAKYRHGASNGTPKKRERKDVVSNKVPHTTFRRKVKKDDDSIKGGFLKKYYSKVGTYDKLDALDWDAVRISKVDDIAKAIVTRGMSNNLATRIKNCLNIFAEDLGSTNLEWIRDVPPHEAKEYLLSIPGLGLKSVECIRLLTLLQKAFPIDRNAGRVAVRLGWVPLQPLPEGQQFHLLKEYPKVDDVQKYLWPRLCKHKPSLLYELHCHMITFGKVFCTKINPNCNACPMRAECKHYASALASSHLALPGIHDENDINSDDPMPLAASFDNEATMVPLLECVSQTEPNSESQSFSPRCLQMVEAQVPIEQDIEDFGLYQIPRIKLDEEKMRETVQKFINENILLQEGQLSKSLMVLTSEMASIPTPKLKNGKHLRTEHQVYVLPDQHWPDILAGLETRVPEESCPYLLAIWSEENINKDECAPEEEKEKTVSGTLLMPVRTAQRGMFPLNGTYFQANEGNNPLDANGYLRSRDILMDQLKGTRQDLLPNITINNKVFADDESSEVPIKVPRKSLWHLPRATLYCGNNISAVCRGMNSHEIQECFWRGYVCFRGFNRKTRDVKPLSARFHLPASKGRKTNGPEDETNSAT